MFCSSVIMITSGEFLISSCMRKKPNRCVRGRTEQTTVNAVACQRPSITVDRVHVMAHYVRVCKYNYVSLDPFRTGQ